MTGPLLQLHQEILNELTFTCKLMSLILKETNQLKEITAPGSFLESNIKVNAKVIKLLGNIQHINMNIENTVPLRELEDIAQLSNQNISLEENDSFRDMSKED